MLSVGFVEHILLATTATFQGGYLRALEGKRKAPPERGALRGGSNNPLLLECLAMALFEVIMRRPTQPGHIQLKEHIVQVV